MSPLGWTASRPNPSWLQDRSDLGASSVPGMALGRQLKRSNHVGPCSVGWNFRPRYDPLSGLGYPAPQAGLGGETLAHPGGVTVP